ncbi:MAG: hypothetical protein ABR923_12995 [Terracidiphilus sp.]
MERPRDAIRVLKGRGDPIDTSARVASILLLPVRTVTHLTEKSRYFDQGMLIAAFAERVFSICPNCSGPVLVTCRSKAGIPFIPKDARATCLRCSFQRRECDVEWHGPVNGMAKRPCPNCGTQWLEQAARGKTPKAVEKDLSLITCTSCGLVTKLDLEFIKERFGSANDPTFGLPLWLQVSCCGHTLWAFNGDHLEKLRQYISASLRERMSNLKWSMFSRLPAWMTSAKNRDAVLKGITHLEEALRSIEQ